MTNINQKHVCRLARKNILVTGVATGIGRETAIRVASEGARVAGFDVNDSEAEITMSTISDMGGDVRYWHADVSKENQVQQSVDEAYAWLGGGIDVLLHIAGILKGSLQHITEVTEDQWDQVIDVNLKGSFLMVKHVARHMATQGSGTIILTSSPAGVTSASSSYAYGSSKGGTHGLAITLEKHLSSHGIRVNDVLPGSINTPLKTGANKETFLNSKDRKAYDVVQQSMASPEGVAAVMAFLASDDASYVRGSIATI